eukprot:5643429-Amphidinium_carterae.1
MHREVDAPWAWEGWQLVHTEDLALMTVEIVQAAIKSMARNHAQDESFALDMEIQTKDAPFSDAFVLRTSLPHYNGQLVLKLPGMSSTQQPYCHHLAYCRTRCKATSLGNDDTQLDAEAHFFVCFVAVPVGAMQTLSQRLMSSFMVHDGNEQVD